MTKTSKTMTSAKKSALTSAALHAFLIEHAGKQLSVSVTAARLHSAYGAPEPAKQPKELERTVAAGSVWEISRGRLGCGKVCWTARRVDALA